MIDRKRVIEGSWQALQKNAEACRAWTNDEKGMLTIVENGPQCNSFSLRLWTKREHC